VPPAFAEAATRRQVTHFGVQARRPDEIVTPRNDSFTVSTLHHAASLDKL